MLRREVLTAGALSAFGCGLHTAQLAIAETAQPSGVGASAKNCILIWLDGGPSHLETYDVKPNAQAEVRGPLQTIATSIPGFALSECLPQTAARMDQVAIIRSMTSPLGEHNLGTHYVLTGYRPTPVLEYPSFHTVGSMHRRQGVLPANIAVPNYRVGGSNFSGTGFLPQQFRPWSLEGDPAKAGFRVQNLLPSDGMTLERLDRRREFVKQLEQLRESDRSQRSTTDFERAFDMISSAAARKAFQLEDEPEDVRRRYGSRTVGQSCLLARRLVEAGVPFVTVNHQGWDTHESLYTRLKEGYTGARDPVGLIPTLDQAFSALLDDLTDSGLITETLIVIAGEFGRTPKLNAAAGRDHWPRAFSVLLAGGPVNGGTIVGQTDRSGEAPVDRPVTPGDLVRTIYTALGIDPDKEVRTADGRPIRLAAPGTEVVSELF
jgi:hypothetical protein